MVRSIFIKLLVWGCLVLAMPASAASVLVFGDSLSAAYGLSNPQQGWVAMLEDHLKPKGHTVINASVSGETTRGGLSRLPALLDRYQPDYLVLELGGNDGLQGLDLNGIQERLQAMITLAQQANSQVILVGIRIPPNYGPRYTEPFFALFGDLAAANNLVYLPFLLEGIAEDPNLMQADGIHPTAAAQPLILQNVLDILPPELR